MPTLPERIVCLTEEPTEVLYALGQQQRIVGISGFTVRPARARQEKPKVSAFTSARVDRILELKPDLAIGFSDIQADIAQALIKRGVEVWIANHRSVEQILGYVLRLGALVGAVDRARQYVDTLQSHIDDVRASAAALPRRPRVYFEEWDEPMITAIEWVSELITIAGGRNVFEDRARGKLAKERFVTPEEVLRADPEVVLCSWCGKAFDPAAFEARPGFSGLSAVRAGRVSEVPAEIILQPGPACLTDGLDFLIEALAPRLGEQKGIHGAGGSE